MDMAEQTAAVTRRQSAPTDRGGPRASVSRAGPLSMMPAQAKPNQTKPKRLARSWVPGDRRVPRCKAPRARISRWPGGVAGTCHDGMASRRLVSGRENECHVSSQPPSLRAASDEDCEAAAAQRGSNARNPGRVTHVTPPSRRLSGTRRCDMTSCSRWRGTRKCWWVGETACEKRPARGVLWLREPDSGPDRWRLERVKHPHPSFLPWRGRVLLASN